MSYISLPNPYIIHNLRVLLSLFDYNDSPKMEDVTDFDSRRSTKVEEILLKILVLRIQVVATIKIGSLLLFKSIVLVLIQFKIY